MPGYVCHLVSRNCTCPSAQRYGNGCALTVVVHLLFGPLLTLQRLVSLAMMSGAYTVSALTVSATVRPDGREGEVVTAYCTGSVVED